MITSEITQNLKDLLDNAPVDDNAAVVLLSDILTNYDPESLKRTWEALSHLYEWHRDLAVNGGDVHAYGLGDGVHYEADLVSSIEEAESKLNEALDKAAKLQAAELQAAPYLRRAA